MIQLPTTTEIRSALNIATSNDAWGGRSLSGYLFDKWLNEERAAAWDEGHRYATGGHDCDWNPYRDR